MYCYKLTEELQLKVPSETHTASQLFKLPYRCSYTDFQNDEGKQDGIVFDFPYHVISRIVPVNSPPVKSPTAKSTTTIAHPNAIFIRHCMCDCVRGDEL